MCPCKKSDKTMNTNEIGNPISSGAAKRSLPPPARTGACPYCMRKHILKARGYARELREDGTREWERENLLENLLLAEDHAEALGDAGFKAAIRGARLIVEDGGLPDMEPLLARAREKIMDAGVKSSPVVERAQTPA